MEKLEVPESLLEWLRERNIDPLDCVLKLIDSAEVALAVHTEFLKEAKRLEKEGELTYAGEKYWTSLKTLILYYCREEELPCERYQDYLTVIEFMAERYGDRTMITEFLNAERLHGEYHPRPQEGENFVVRREMALSLAEKIKKIILPDS